MESKTLFSNLQNYQIICTFTNNFQLIHNSLGMETKNLELLSLLAGYVSFVQRTELTQEL